jgi:hypothetical protein
MNIYDSKNIVRGSDPWFRYRQVFYRLLHKCAVKKMVVPAVILVLVTIVLGCAYVADQQILRQGANDPQIQLAEDAAAALSRGASAPAIVSSGAQIDISESLSPFITIFNKQGTILQSSGVLGILPPAPPRGVFNYMQTHSEDRITWEPRAGVRIAAVIVSFKGRAAGYVLAGRLLTEVEKREGALFWQFFTAWILSLIVIVCSHVIYEKFRESPVDAG